MTESFEEDYECKVEKIRLRKRLDYDLPYFLVIDFSPSTSVRVDLLEEQYDRLAEILSRLKKLEEEK